MALLPTAPRAVPFARRLAEHGDRLAVACGDTSLTYAELARRVDDLAARLGNERRLVLVAGANALDPLVAYLAGLAAGHPVLLAPGEDDDRVDALVSAYDPDVVVRRQGERWSLSERRNGSAHDLHPDLALLLTTSGSTGSPKLVRLSHRNLEANAASIADYLGLREDDRAATTLPLHYCYGLSVVNSHLLRGGALVLTDLSVVDDCFWRLLREWRCTSLAGVPYTFDLLDRVGFADQELPDLRRVTQAGGRLAPALVRRYAALGRRRGFDLVVMYGQTEATARMAYLPPALAETRPGAIGVPIPGGAFRLDPVPEGEPGVGEIVYSGPNVMMGYAESPADLRLGGELDELRTGDLGRLADDGLYEVVGRRSRIAKVFGVRIDLQHVESVLAGRGVSAACAEVPGGLAVVAEGSDASERVRRVAAATCGLPAHAVTVHAVPGLPRLPNGKVDLVAVRALAAQVGPPGDPGGDGRAGAASIDDLRALYAAVLDRPVATVTGADSFAGLGGDSLSFVELSLRLEDVLGHLPPQWHLTPVADLVAAAGRAPRPRTAVGRLLRWPAVDGSVALRAVAILLVVGSHADVVDLVGGAHVLLAVAGYNVARFHLTGAPAAERRRALLRTVARLAVPALVWVAFWFAVTDRYDVANLVFLNSLFGPDEMTAPWEYWFVEALVQTLLVLVAVLGVPAVDRWERRWPFGFAAAVVAVGLLPRVGAVELGPGPDAIQSAPAVLWLVGLGWAAARATTAPRRLAVTAAAALAVPGFFGDPQREAIILAGIALLVWMPTVRLPRPVRAAAGLLAAHSLYIYLTHWQVFPHLQDEAPRLALVASVVVGVAYGHLVGLASGWGRRALATRRVPAVDAAGPGLLATARSVPGPRHDAGSLVRSR